VIAEIQICEALICGDQAKQRERAVESTAFVATGYDKVCLVKITG
jgi:hypothetical protein